MKKFGDVVTLVRNGQPLEALVAQSQVQPDGEHLTVVYLDPAFAGPIMGGSALQRAVATAFAVPLKDGSVNGWKDVEVIEPTALAHIQMNAADEQAKNDKAWESQLADLKQQVLNLQHLLDQETHAKDAAIAAVVQAGKVRTVRFGLGEVVVTPGTSGGAPAVTIAPVEGKDGTTVVLEFHNEDGAKVLVNDVTAMFPGGGPVPVPPTTPTA